jgi:hypothetical protein
VPTVHLGEHLLDGHQVDEYVTEITEKLFKDIRYYSLATYIDLSLGKFDND